MKDSIAELAARNAIAEEFAKDYLDGLAEFDGCLSEDELAFCDAAALVYGGHDHITTAAEVYKRHAASHDAISIPIGEPETKIHVLMDHHRAGVSFTERRRIQVVEDFDAFAPGVQRRTRKVTKQFKGLTKAYEIATSLNYFVMQETITWVDRQQKNLIYAGYQFYITDSRNKGPANDEYFSDIFSAAERIAERYPHRKLKTETIDWFAAVGELTEN